MILCLCLGTSRTVDGNSAAEQCWWTV